MCSQYFYLDLETNLNSPDRAELSVQSTVQKALRELFGECCPAHADVLHVSDGGARCVLRVRGCHLRHVRAALALAAPPVRVRVQAASLQALV